MVPRLCLDASVIASKEVSELGLHAASFYADSTVQFMFLGNDLSRIPKSSGNSLRTNIVARRREGKQSVLLAGHMGGDSLGVQS